MGDPRKARKKYKTPSHPWQKARLDEESELVNEYGLKNKKEIWKMNSILANFTNQSKKLVAIQTKQADLEKINLIKKLKSYGLLEENQTFEDILNLTVKDIMEKRLETLVHRKGLAKTMKQSRQLITHSHIMVGNKTITAPSFLVTKPLENSISFCEESPLANPDHAERIVKEDTKPKKKEDKEKVESKKEDNEESSDDADKKEKVKSKKPKASKKEDKVKKDNKKSSDDADKKEEVKSEKNTKESEETKKEDDKSEDTVIEGKKTEE